MRIRIDIIVFWIMVVLTIVFASLISVWLPFVIFTSVCLLISSGIYTFWQYAKYKDLCNNIDEQRFEDAYIYADENNLSFDPQKFKYSKKDERYINRYKKNARLLLLTGCGIFVLGLFMLIYAIFNI